LRRHPGNSYESGRVAVVYHPRDEDCRKAVCGYLDLLTKSDDTFVDLSLDRVVDAWTPVVAGTEHEDWLTKFRLRYLDLAASEPAYARYRDAMGFSSREARS
jgi:hypothetical protein